MASAPPKTPPPAVIRTQRVDEQALMAKEVMRRKHLSLLFCGGTAVSRLHATLRAKFKEHEEDHLRQIRSDAAAADPMLRIAREPRRPSLQPPQGHRRVVSSFEAAYSHGHGGRRVLLASKHGISSQPPRRQVGPGPAREAGWKSELNDRPEVKTETRVGTPHAPSDAAQSQRQGVPIPPSSRSSSALGRGEYEATAEGEEDRKKAKRYNWFKERRNRISKDAEQVRDPVKFLRIEGLSS